VNGFVDSALAFGEVMEVGMAAGSFAWFIFLKNGFLVSAPYEDEEGVGAGGGGAAGAEGGDCIEPGRGDCMGAEGGLVGVGCVLCSLDKT